MQRPKSSSISYHEFHLIQFAKFNRYSPVVLVSLTLCSRAASGRAFSHISSEICFVFIHMQQEPLRGEGLNVSSSIDCFAEKTLSFFNNFFHVSINLQRKNQRHQHFSERNFLLHSMRNTVCDISYYDILYQSETRYKVLY